MKGQQLSTTEPLEYISTSNFALRNNICSGGICDKINANNATKNDQNFQSKLNSIFSEPCVKLTAYSNAKALV